MPRCLPILTSFFDRYLIDSCSQLGPPEPYFSSHRCRESTIQQKIVFRNRHRFLIDFGANLRPFFLPKSTKIVLKTDLERHRFFDRFLHRFFLHFGSILGPMLGPCWLLFRYKTPSRRLQDGPRCLQRRFGSPKTAREASKPAPEPSRPRFWTIFDRFLDHF